MIQKKVLLSYGADSGFQEVRVLSTSQILHIITHYGKQKGFSLARVKEKCIQYFGKNFFTPGVSFPLLICGLSYYRNEKVLLPDDMIPYGLLAPFAQRNYYAEAVHRLKKVALKIREKTGLKKSDIRIFCNSGAPEKFFAWASGLGNYGKNSLIINKTLGSSFIIAGLVVFSPFTDTPENQEPVDCGSPNTKNNTYFHDHLKIPDLPGSMCSDCRSCMVQCPTLAIKSPGCIDLTQCIQALSTSLVLLPESIKQAFGNRIYGCQICQDVCPWNKNLSRETQDVCGALGPRISLKTILGKTPENLRIFLRKSVPGSSWIDMRAIQRNALIAAGNLGDPTLIDVITPYRKNQHLALIDAASWALKRIAASS